MRLWISAILIAVLLQQPDAETRVVNYLKSTVKPGQPVEISQLNSALKAPDEQKVLQRILNTIPKIPLAIAEFQSRLNRVPTLQELSEQFDFKVAGEADVVLRLMESDSRIPKFVTRNASTGEISRIDLAAIKGDPRFADAILQNSAEWQGRAAPNFAMISFSTLPVNSAQVRGQPHLVYLWFTNCAPCTQTTTSLVRLYDKYSASGFQIVAANADKVLGLPYTDLARADVVRKQGIRFPVGQMTPVMQQAYGGTIYPALFFVNRQGRIARHLVGPQPEAALDAAIQESLK